MSYLKLPITIVYKTSAKARTVKVKVLRGNTSNNIDKIVNIKVPGISEKAILKNISIGYKFIPTAKLTASDKKHLSK